MWRAQGELPFVRDKVDLGTEAGHDGPGVCRALQMMASVTVKGRVRAKETYIEGGRKSTERELRTTFRPDPERRARCCTDERQIPLGANLRGPGSQASGTEPRAPDRPVPVERDEIASSALRWTDPPSLIPIRRRESRAQKQQVPS